MSINDTAENLQIRRGGALGSYTVEDFLGEGGFGFVSKCRHEETGRMVAIKVNKPEPEIIRQARIEIDMLRSLQCLDPDTCNIIRWNGFFFTQDHICLEFELLDQSLRDYMCDRNYTGLPIEEISPVVYQLTTALSHLKSIGIVHADLKPDNIMITDRRQQPLKVKLIDFGLARPLIETKPDDNVQTRWYRAPEVLIGSLYNEAIDMWSLGLTAAELALGFTLYPGETEYDVLRFIKQTQGQPANYLLDCGLVSTYYFNKLQNGQRRWRFKKPREFAYETGYNARETRRIKLKSLDELEKFVVVKSGHQRDQRLFIDLVKKMLELDPDHRIKPLEVLQHPFFNNGILQSPHPNTIQIDEIVPEVITEPNTHQTAGEENTQQHRIPRIATPTQDESETLEENNPEQTRVQPEQDGWFRRLYRRITGAFYNLFQT
ncbi:hypothetical protein PAMP_010589 [Pampus punctatissimus]